MSPKLGVIGGTFGEFGGATADWDARVRVPWMPARVPGGGAARRLPWGRREKRRVIAVRPQIVSVRSVRAELWSACRVWHVAELAECVAACASELVTNAIVHATWPNAPDVRLRVIVSRSARTLMVEVCDPDPEWPTPRALTDWGSLDWNAGGAAGESGLGLRLVRARVAELGGEFGCASGVEGKTVFFILPLSGGARHGVAAGRGGVAP